MREAENTIGSLSDKEAGTAYKDGYVTIENMIRLKKKGGIDDGYELP